MQIFVFFLPLSTEREEGQERDSKSRLAKENAAEEGSVNSGMTGGEEDGTMGVAIGNESSTDVLHIFRLELSLN